MYTKRAIPEAISFWIDTKWGCGGLEVLQDGTVVGGAPIFKKFYKQNIVDLAKKYKVLVNPMYTR